MGPMGCDDDAGDDETRGIAGGEYDLLIHRAANLDSGETSLADEFKFIEYAERFRSGAAEGGVHKRLPVRADGLGGACERAR